MKEKDEACPMITLFKENVNFKKQLNFKVGFAEEHKRVLKPSQLHEKPLIRYWFPWLHLRKNS